MAPRFLVDAERPLRSTSIQDLYRFWLTFQLKDYTYKRWFQTEYERDCYKDFNIPGGVVIDSGELPRMMEGRL